MRTGLRSYSGDLKAGAPVIRSSTDVEFGYAGRASSVAEESSHSSVSSGSEQMRMILSYIELS